MDLMSPTARVATVASLAVVGLTVGVLFAGAPLVVGLAVGTVAGTAALLLARRGPLERRGRSRWRSITALFALYWWVDLVIRVVHRLTAQPTDRELLDANLAIAAAAAACLTLLLVLERDDKQPQSGSDDVCA